MGLVVSPHAEGPGPQTQGKSRRGDRSFKKGAGAAKGNPSPAHNNYDHGEGPRLGGRGCQKGQQCRRTNSESQQILPTQASVRNPAADPAARARDGGEGAERPAVERPGTFPALGRKHRLGLRRSRPLSPGS